MIQIKVVIGYWLAKFFKHKEPQLHFCEDKKNLKNNTRRLPCVYYNYLGEKPIKYLNVFVKPYDVQNKLLKKQINLKIVGPIAKKEKNLKNKKIFFEPLPKETHYLELIKVALTYEDKSKQIILGKKVAVYKDNTSPKSPTKKVKILKLWSAIYKNFTKAIKKLKFFKPQK